jgi:hypothetical protein
MIGLNTRLFFGIGTTRPILHATIYPSSTKAASPLPEWLQHDRGSKMLGCSQRLPATIDGAGSERRHYRYRALEYPVKVWGGSTSMTDITASRPTTSSPSKGGCETR